jgi:hypothetical protein
MGHTTATQLSLHRANGDLIAVATTANGEEVRRWTTRDGSRLTLLAGDRQASRDEVDGAATLLEAHIPDEWQI